MYGERKATAEEIKVFEKLNNELCGLSDDVYEKAIEEISDFVWSYGEERKAAYNKLRKWAKKMNCKVVDFETWYCIDECI